MDAQHRPPTEPPAASRGGWKSGGGLGVLRLRRAPLPCDLPWASIRIGSQGLGGTVALRTRASVKCRGSQADSLQFHPMWEATGSFGLSEHSASALMACGLVPNASRMRRFTFTLPVLGAPSTLLPGDSFAA